MDATTPANPAAPKPKKCYRHAWLLTQGYYGNENDISIYVCDRCHEVKDEVRSRRNKNNGKRGRSDEAKVAAILGGRKVGPMNWPWDVELEGYMRAQAKQLDRWPSMNEIIKWLDAIPAGDYLRAVTLADTPGAGKRTSRYIVIQLDEFARFHGKVETE